MSNTPSLTELHSLASQHTYSVAEPTRCVTDTVAFARAVLARWGTPQPTAAEFALQALIAAGHVSQELVDKALTLPGAPQPVVREPLGNKELQAISLEYSDSEDECTGFRDGWRFAEKHYGITQKGGQHER